jgi:uncharacterized membrane protein
MANQAVSDQASRFSNLATTLLLLLVLLLALGLRLYGLDAQSLWNDEGTSVAIAQRSLVTIAQDAANDIHPPLYYWLLAGWVRLFGTGEVAIRSLSALLGVVLVALSFVLGCLLAGRWVGLLAAFLAAIHPFQIYYSQEARMYMLLAVLTAGGVLVVVQLVRQGVSRGFAPARADSAATSKPNATEPTEKERTPSEGGRVAWLTLAALVLLETAGLYTHYSFVFVILVLNAGYVLQVRPKAFTRQMGPWLLSQLVVVVLYMPWLPTAVRQVTTWPGLEESTPFLPALANIWRWVVFGPTVETEQVLVPLVIAALVAAFGVLALAARRVGKSSLRGWWSSGLSVFWLGLPVVLMFTLGLYREAYLKFLLVVTPAVSLFLACGILSLRPPDSPVAEGTSRSRRQMTRSARYTLLITQLIVVMLMIPPYALALQNYYAEPAYARDDYRGIVRYIEAVSRPGDLVILNAPGQQEVFEYYHQGETQVYPMPESRPLDPAATEARLVEISSPGSRVFAVLWATDESDPDRFVEGWLDSYAYKALDSWYGNVRLAVYAVQGQAPTMPDQDLGVPFYNNENGDEIVLLGYSLLDNRLAAGDIAQAALFWQADQTPSQRYKVFVHVLDEDNQIVGQRDAEPGGGMRLTTLWEPGDVVADNHGILVHPATPPGTYEVIAGLYDATTGQRLVTPDGADHVRLEPLQLERPPTAAPVAALGMQHEAMADFGQLALLGFDAHKLGFAHQPQTPLRPGEVVHVNLYWQAGNQPGGEWRIIVALLDGNGRRAASLTTVPVPGYPASLWQEGDVWRGQFNLLLAENLSPGSYRLEVQALRPDGVLLEPYLSEPVLSVD